MKKLLFILTIIFAVAVTAKAQISFNIGNAEMETDLNEINANAKLDLGKFKADLSLTFGAPKPKVDAVFALNIEPAEAFLIFQIGQIANQPVDNVIASYKKNKGKGWGVIAKEMGIKPGSAEFHALKNKTKNKKGKGKKEEKGNNGKGKGKGKK